MLEITEAARDRFRKLLIESDKEGYAIRIFVSAGGCCPSYGLDVSENGEHGDDIIEAGDLKLFVEPTAHEQLSNATIDYANGFVIRGTSSSCCG